MSIIPNWDNLRRARELVLNRPPFRTDEQHARVVRHFVNEYNRVKSQLTRPTMPDRYRDTRWRRQAESEGERELETMLDRAGL